MRPIVAIRHAQSEHHVTRMTGGWTDTDLTELGRRQAQCLAWRLERELSTFPCRICCSDLRRALQTANAIGMAMGLTPEPVVELRELNNGIAAGMPEDEARKYARELTSPALDWQPYPRAETWRQFYSRVAACMDRLIGKQEKILLLVTHAGTISNIVVWWLQLEIESNVSFETSPASISVLRVNQWEERTIERLNDTAHLYAAGLSDETRLHL